MALTRMQWLLDIPQRFDRLISPTLLDGLVEGDFRGDVDQEITIVEKENHWKARAPTWTS